MRTRLAFSTFGCLAFAVLTTPVGAANAYLSHTGSGAACTITTPCANMAFALAVAGTGGEVICLDKGNFGNGTVFTQAVTISCGDGLWEAPGGTVSIQPPAGAEVVIEGLVIDGQASGCCSLGFTGQGSLRLRRVRSGNVVGASSHGLQFTPNGPAKLFVDESVFYNNGGSGILIAPAGGVTKAVIRNTVSTNNASVGVLIQPSGSSSVQIETTGLDATGNLGGVAAVAASGTDIELQVRDSVLSQNSNYGLVSQTTGGVSVAFVDHSSISQNGSIGLYATGQSAYLLVNASTIERNNIGWAFASSGQLLSYSNNVVLSASSYGSPSGTIGLQ